MCVCVCVYIYIYIYIYDNPVISCANTGPVKLTSKLI